MISLRPSAWSLFIKLPFIVCLVVATVAAVIGMGVVEKDRAELRRALSARAELLARWVAAGSADSMLHNDPWSTFLTLRQVVSDGVGRDDHVVTAMVLDRDRRVIAHLRPAENPIGLPLVAPNEDERRLLSAAMAMTAPGVLEADGGQAIEGIAPVVAGAKSLGIVRVRLSTHHLSEALQESAMVVLALTLALTAIGSIIGVGLSLGAVRPLKRLADAMGQLGRGEHAPIMVPISGNDEIARLGEAFNRMAEEVAEKQRLERELAQSEKVAALGRVAAGVAHEVNNPLAGILNCVSTIRDHPEEVGLIDRYLPVIERGLLRIRAIIQDLLIEQRAENAINPSGPACLDEIRDLILAEVQGHSIVLEWDNRVPANVLVNRPQLQQAALNLLKNVVQAMADGGRLRFTATADSQSLCIEVEDSGVGIDPDDLGRIFDPFFSLRRGGTGLGLWITFRLVQAMGGSIEVSSEPGLGTLFKINVPVEGKADGPTTH